MTYNMYKRTEKTKYFMKEFNSYKIPFDKNSDYELVIEHKYENKPKLLAYDLYGHTSLSWVFSYFNRDLIEDPIFDLTVGLKIIVPTKERLFKYL